MACDTNDKQYKKAACLIQDKRPVKAPDQPSYGCRFTVLFPVLYGHAKGPCISSLKLHSERSLYSDLNKTENCLRIISFSFPGIALFSGIIIAFVLSEVKKPVV